MSDRMIKKGLIGFDTCKNRRRGLGGPLEAWEWRQGVCLQATFPSLPALILQPETTSSRHQSSGLFCHKTKPPTSPPPPCRKFLTLTTLLFTLPSPALNSEAAIFTFPIAYMLSIHPKAFSPPTAAVYCFTIYFAVEASYKKKQNPKFINIKKKDKILIW